MKRKTKILIAVTVIPLLCLISAPIAFFGFWIFVSGGTDAGSPELAREWRERLDQFSTYQEAETAEPSVEIIKFDNGEYIFGWARNSHGMGHRGGGTMVMKDSNGKTRGFYGGHVCGNGYLSRGFSGSTDLVSFYDRVAEQGFEEYEFD